MPFGSEASLIWFSPACSLPFSMSDTRLPVENMYHTEQETSRVPDTTPSAHSGRSLCCPFPVPACSQCLHHVAYWFKSTVVCKDGHQQLHGRSLTIEFCSINCRENCQGRWKCPYCRDMFFCILLMHRILYCSYSYYQEGFIEDSTAITIFKLSRKNFFFFKST